jgi:hypothetical protein
MVMAVDAATVWVVTVKVALVAPATTDTLAGTVAMAVLLLESATTTPPDGAAPVNTTVPREVPPPVTVVGLRASDERVTAGGGGATGETVSVAVLMTPPNDPEMVTEVDVATEAVVTVKAALVAPAATVTLEGTEATEGFALLRLTRAPPLGAPPVNVIVPCAAFPPTTEVGLTLTAERLAAAGAACAVNRRDEEKGPATPAELRARTRQKNRCAGRPVTVACDTATVWLRVSGAVKLLESSICIS